MGKVCDLVDVSNYEKCFKKLSSDLIQIKEYELRFISLYEKYIDLFNDKNDLKMFSAPGRTEICGNHTDHQKGKVIAASVNLDIIAISGKNKSDIVRIKSDGYEIDEVSINDLEMKVDEKNTSKAIIKGILFGFKKMGYKIGGFDAYTSSNVLKGSGLSSSAAFEILIATIINNFFNSSSLDELEISEIGKYAENNYYGKPCGLMDQMASAYGGTIFIDFSHEKYPLVKKIDLNLSNQKFKLCIIDCGGSHENLTNEYSDIINEMKMISIFFKKEFLSQVTEVDFFNNINKLREETNDRAVLRAMHFYEENKRVNSVLRYIEKNNFSDFLNVIKKSGYSSYMYLQNVYTSNDIYNQAISIGLALCDKFLDKKGSYRVHGGGFAGTIQAFVPENIVLSFKENIEKVYGKNKCYILDIRNYGGICINDLI